MNTTIVLIFINVNELFAQILPDCVEFGNAVRIALFKLVD